MPERIRKRLYDEPTPINIYSDFDWVRQHEKELLAQYGECSILVYDSQVIGVGATYDEAVADVERRLPPELTGLTPIHHRLRQHTPLSRIRWQRKGV
jgi:hypothetical protein